MAMPPSSYQQSGRSNYPSALSQNLSSCIAVDRSLSWEAAQLVELALNKIRHEPFPAVTESVGSTQVLIPIQSIPEASLAYIPASPSFITKHTWPMESTLDVGHEIHRNNAESAMAPLYRCDTMMEEMCNIVVASHNVNGTPLSYLQNVCGRFAEVSQAISSAPNNKNTPDAALRLPPEVQERALRTLNEVRMQLDSVRNQLMRPR